MERFIKRFIFAILFLVFYFVVFVNFIPMIDSFIDAFIDQHRDLFKIQFKTSEFIYDNTTNTINVTDKYITVDFTILLKFIPDFVFYVFIPVMSILILVKVK